MEPKILKLWPNLWSASCNRLPPISKASSNLSLLFVVQLFKQYKSRVQLKISHSLSLNHRRRHKYRDAKRKTFHLANQNKKLKINIISRLNVPSTVSAILLLCFLLFFFLFRPDPINKFLSRGPFDIGWVAIKTAANINTRKFCVSPSSLFRFYHWAVRILKLEIWHNVEEANKAHHTRAER